MLTIGVIIVLALGESGAQDPLFSQYNSSPLFLNPAFAGTSQFKRISLCYRNQNPAMGSSYVTYFASYDQYVELLQGGLGFNIMHDVQENGVLRKLSLDAIYTYHLIINPELTVSAGIQASYGHRFMQTGALHFTDGVDPTGRPYVQQPDNSLDDQKGYPDVSVGFLGITRFTYIGFAAHHLNKPNMSFRSNMKMALPWKFTVHGGTILPLYERRLGKEALRLNPGIVLIYQGGCSQFNYGVDVWAGNLFAGIWARQNLPLTISSVSVVAGYSGEIIRIGYSYDFNVLQSYREGMKAGAHELSLALKLGYDSSQRMKRKAIKFPIF